jgi:hypothetical protein
MHRGGFHGAGSCRRRKWTCAGAAVRRAPNAKIKRSLYLASARIFKWNQRSGWTIVHPAFTFLNGS